MVISVLAAVASAWGVLMGLSPVLQIRRMLRQRSSREVSLGYFAILLAGFLLWISYGIAAGNMWLVVPNSIALLVGLALVAIALRLRRFSPADPGSAHAATPRDTHLPSCSSGRRARRRTAP